MSQVGTPPDLSIFCKRYLEGSPKCLRCLSRKQRTQDFRYRIALAMCSLMAASVWITLIGVRAARLTTVSWILRMVLIQEEVLIVVAFRDWLPHLQRIPTSRHFHGSL